jgi:hypothetical protein
MDILRTILLMGITFSVLILVQHLILNPFCLLMRAIFKLNLYDKGSQTANIFNFAAVLYVLVSLLTLIITTAYQKTQSPALFTTCSIIGFLVTVGVGGNTIGNKIKNSFYAYEQAHTGKAFSRQFSLDGIVFLASLPLFVTALFFPALVTNLVTLKLFQMTLWLSNLPIVGWVLSIIGILTMLIAVKIGFAAFAAMLLRPKVKLN